MREIKDPPMTHHGNPQTAQLIVPVGPSDHAQGNAAAPVTLVEYGDYQCPYCGEAYPIVKAIQRVMGKRLRFVFRNMPLAEVHPQAELAAEAAEAAAAQGKFWEMHDALYEHQDELGPQLVAQLSTRLGLDGARLRRDLEQGAFRERVRRDFMGGVRSGVAGTPTFYINGERYEGKLDAASMVDAMRE
jgi:protein-disulfide isomerase